MKAKVYPLNQINGTVNIPASNFFLHIEIICASLASKTSIIKNLINSKDIDTTINWCKNIGANIKKNQDRLIIKGVDNKISFSNSLFHSSNIMTIKLMLPLLCCVSQPVGIKTERENIKKLVKYKPIFEASGVVFYEDYDSIRVEEKIDEEEIDLSSLNDVASIVGFLIAAPLLNYNIKLKINENINLKNEVLTIIKLLKKYNVDYKLFNNDIMVEGYQKFKNVKITTEMDKRIYLLSILLSFKNVEDKKMLISNYQSFSIQNDEKIFLNMKKNMLIVKDLFGKHTIKPKEHNFDNLNFLDAYYQLPFIMILAALNKKSIIISNLNVEDKKIMRKFQIMEEVLNSLGYSVTRNETLVAINKIKDNNKIQIDCYKDIEIATILSYFALFLKEPLIIKNVDSLLSSNKEFYENMKLFGAKIELIHD